MVSDDPAIVSTELPAIVSLDTLDEDAVLALLRSGLGPGSTPRTREFWRWKHLESPFGPSPGLAAVVGGEVVALRVFLRWRFRGAGVEHQVVRAVDTATHPAWRRRGLFRRLTTELMDELSGKGVSFIFNTPNRVSLRGYRKLGWKSSGRTPLAIKPIATRAFFTRRSDIATPTALGRPIEDLLAQPQLAGFLSRLWQDESRLHTARDTAYLAWRYARIPGVPYRAVYDFDSSSGAVVIARPRLRRGRAEVALAEVLVGPGESSSRRALALLEEMTAAAAGGIDYFVAVPSRRSEESTVLRRAGFFVAPGFGRHLVVRRLALAPDLRDPIAARHWRWSLGDLELF